MTNHDPQHLSFSQAQGYEALPQPLRLEELTREARVGIWNILYEAVDYELRGFESHPLWTPLFRAVYADFLHLPLDSWEGTRSILTGEVRNIIIHGDFNWVFDLLTFILRDTHCPYDLKLGMAVIFEKFQLAYSLDMSDPPTIYPVSTPEEGNALIQSLEDLSERGLVGAREHLRQAANCISQEDWAGAIRESIHAVESVACQIAPGTKTLGEALKVLKQSGLLEHPALEQGFDKIYGYTNDERGIRHALLDQSSADVGIDEALFMFGACASFASYLSRKQSSV
ncbi:MAG: hypothetical protein OXT51_10775 [Chloroflexota bacterium]|nr:hypothetical protein [Chloroflexota bacterium]